MLPVFELSVVVVDELAKKRGDSAEEMGSFLSSGFCLTSGMVGEGFFFFCGGM